MWIHDLINVPRLGKCYVLYKYNDTLIILGPDWYGCLVSFTVLFVSTLFALVLLRQQSYPIYQRLIYFLCCLIGTFLTMLVVKDPGILTSKACVIAGEDCNLIFCDTCNVYQRNNAKHCPTCNCCVEEFHHHCFWLGKCVGKQNRKLYNIFNITWIIYLFLVVYLLSKT